MYRTHFGLKHDPLGKSQTQAVDQAQYQPLSQKLNWLLDSKGIGLITGEPGVGKTTAIQQWTQTLNPLTHKVLYQPDNHFQAFDLYSQLAESLGLERQHRYSRLWRSLKEELMHQHDDKQITPIWILDEAQQVPMNFLQELPAFMNYGYDNRDVLVIVLMGTKKLKAMLQRKTYRSLVSRIQFHYEWEAIEDIAQFSKILSEAIQAAGRQERMLTETGINLIHMGSRGHLRYAHRILTRSLQLAAEQNLNHLPDEIIEAALEELRSMTV